MLLTVLNFLQIALLLPHPQHYHRPRFLSRPQTAASLSQDYWTALNFLKINSMLHGHVKITDHLFEIRDSAQNWRLREGWKISRLMKVPISC